MVNCSALLDSNVVIATVAEAHPDHTASLALFTSGDASNYRVSAHSYAEVFTTLTKRSPRSPLHWPAERAWAGLESIAAVTTLVGATPAQTVEAVRLYATNGNIGARLYDFLIGRAAILAGTESIVTWNIGQFRDLFPDRLVETPDLYLARILSG